MIFLMYECEERIGYTFRDKTLLRTNTAAKTTNGSSFSAIRYSVL